MRSAFHGRARGNSGLRSGGQTWRVARDIPSPDAIAAAIRLLTDHGYIVMRAQAPALSVTPVLPMAEPPDKPRKEYVEVPASVPDDSLELMTLKQFCRRVAISRSLAYVHIQKGDLKVTKIGRATRISGASARAWLANFKGNE